MHAVSYRFLLLIPGQLVLALGSACTWAQQGGDYAGNLAALYGEHQWVIAVRETCTKSHPQHQTEIERAFGAWRDRHRQLIDDLESRLVVIVRGASKDDKDYSRNYARSQSEVLKQRAESRKQLLALPKEDLQRLCTDFPGYLRDTRSDIAQRLPEEYAAIYGRKSP